MVLSVSGLSGEIKSIKSDPKSTAGRPAEKPRLLGQVITPRAIAKQMVRHLFNNRREAGAKILDPCVGPYTFPLTIVESGLLRPNDTLTIVDLDPEMIDSSIKWGTAHGISLDKATVDYLERAMSDQYDYAIMNPPYIRQEWLDKKSYYKVLFKERYDTSIPGTSNLYVYFIVKLIMDLRPGGKFACIVYDSWQSTLYGRWLFNFMNSHCESLEFETVPSQPFNDRLIDAIIIYGTKKKIASEPDQGIDRLSQTLNNDSPLARLQGFRVLNSTFTTQRGLRLKQADFFLCKLSECVKFGATPFLKKVGKLNGTYCVPKKHPEAALLVSSDSENHAAIFELERRIEQAEQEPEKNISILTWFRERQNSWYLHRKPPYAPIVFNYYLRNRPRHIFNPDRPFSDNFYGLAPLDDLSPLAYLAVLNSTATCTEIMANSRNQGNGLAKIQLFEYRRIHIPDIRQCTKTEQSSFRSLGSALVERPHLQKETIRRIDDLVYAVIADARLKPSSLQEIFKEVDLRARNPKESGRDVMVNLCR